MSMRRDNHLNACCNKIDFYRKAVLSIGWLNIIFENLDRR